MVRLLVEAENDVGAVGIVHNGEMAPALQLLQRAIGDFSRLRVVENGDGFGGERELRYGLLRERCNSGDERERKQEGAEERLHLCLHAKFWIRVANSSHG